MRAIGFQEYNIKDFERMLLELGKHREYYRMGSNWQNERIFETVSYTHLTLPTKLEV